MANVYKIKNYAMPTTAAPTPVASGTGLKTMLQIKLGTQNTARIIEWGISFDGSVAAAPGTVELIETAIIPATVTAAVAADIDKFDPNAVDPTTSNLIVSTTATGYTASAEGTIVATRTFDIQQLPGTGPYVKQFPLGREPMLNISTYLRIRVKFAATVNVLCYVDIEV